MDVETTEWAPDWAVAPGEILAELLAERDLSQSELARRMGRPIKTINEIIKGKAAITPETAIQLELTLNVPSSFWTNLETRYRSSIARKKALDAFDSHKSWAERFPIKDLVRNGLLRPTYERGELVAAILGYFGVATTEAWGARWSTLPTSYRRSAAFEPSKEATAAWLRWGEILAGHVETEPFDAAELSQALNEARSMTRKADFALTLQRVQALLAGAGVALVCVPEFAGIHVSGATRWLSADKAIIQLSMRHRSDDHFWFSLFHEGGHALDPTRNDFVDEFDDTSEDAAEVVADLFARDILVPPSDYAVFVESSNLGLDAVREFAKQINVAPGLVVGRLQHDGHLAPNKLNSLKQPIKWQVR